MGSPWGVISLTTPSRTVSGKASALISAGWPTATRGTSSSSTSAVMRSRRSSPIQHSGSPFLTAPPTPASSPRPPLPGDLERRRRLIELAARALVRLAAGEVVLEQGPVAVDLLLAETQDRPHPRHPPP